MLACAIAAPAQRYVPPRPSRSFTLYGGPWRTDGQFDSIVHIKVGSSAHVISITPTLYLADGTAVALPVMTVPPMGNADLDIAKALAAQPAGAGWLRGSIALTYRAQIPYVKATLEIADSGNSGLAETFSVGPSSRPQPTPLGPMPENLPPAMVKKYNRALLRQQNRARAAAQAADPQPYEALWSKSTATATAWFALSNVTGSTTTADYAITGAQGSRVAGPAITLPPHATEMVSLEPLISQLPQAERQAGGLEIDPHAPSGATLVAGALYDPAPDTNLSLQFLRKGRALGPPGHGRLAVVGLPVGSPPADFDLPAGITFAPEVSFRNATDAPLAVAVKLEITAGTSDPAPLCKFELPVTLAPQQERDLALGTALATDRCAASGMINLVASFRGHRGDLEMEAHSTDTSGNYTADTELHALDNIFKPATGLERWANANGQTTLITLWNPSGRPQKLRLQFTGGSGLTMRVVHSNRICDQCYFLPLALPANGSVTFSTAQLRTSAPPDQFGRSFPAASSGSLKIVTQATPLPDATGIVDLRKSGPQQVGIAIGALVVSPAGFAAPAGAPAARPAVLRLGGPPAAAERSHGAAKLVRARLQVEAIGVCQVSPDLIGGFPCGYEDDAEIWYNSAYVGVQGTVQTGIQAGEEPDREWEDLPNPGFNSSNTGIATVDSNGLVTGVSIGSVTISASDFVQIWNSAECECPWGDLGASATITVNACGDDPGNLSPVGLGGETGTPTDRGALIAEYGFYGPYPPVGVQDDSGCARQMPHASPTHPFSIRVVATSPITATSVITTTSTR